MIYEECDYNITDTPIFLENEGDEKFVLFGDWPQVLKEDNVKIDKSKSYIINSWNCYKGSDGCYYVEENANPYKKAFMFNNGNCILKNELYYFKMQSIKWRILDTDYQGGKLILSDLVLCSSMYDIHYDENIEKSSIRVIDGHKVYPNNYKYSGIRAFLNGLNGKAYGEEDFTGNGFIDKAFSKKALNLINTTKIDNSKESILGRNEDASGYDTSIYVCEDTEDKIFLLSKVEVTKKEYHFGDCFERFVNILRIKKSTDYALAKGAYFDLCDGDGMSWWWLRSPIYDIRNWCSSIISVDGDAFSIGFVNHKQGGVVPALVLK